ncbi:hypothetical protein MT325_m641L [Paramecium bursaria chlorella virus MT325]|uniref:Uncharacterized protein m641L n=1 Tax=Paramecium bursaria Chlorella virus MT325 TaxID=346932 RepID=A7IV21_PBCVM|nr:hypothetical protein MT325_m641L [Paramecium bursaria chlorella virus MT325]
MRKPVTPYSRGFNCFPLWEVQFAGQVPPHYLGNRVTVDKNGSWGELFDTGNCFWSCWFVPRRYWGSHI